MSSYWTDQAKIVELGSLNLGAGAASVVFQPGLPVDVKSIILVTTTAQASAGAVLTFTRREADGSGGEVTIGTATTPATMALNSVYKIDIAHVDPDRVTTDGTGVSQPSDVTTGRVVGHLTNQPGMIRVNPGQELVIASGGEGDTGVATVYVEYVQQGPAYDRNPATVIPFVPA